MNKERETALVYHGCVFWQSGDRLFERIYARCSDLSLSGSRVGVGDFDQDGLGVSDVWGDGRSGNFGLASSRK